MPVTTTRPSVGVGVFVLNREGRFVIGKRRGSHGGGTWGLPGGHLEHGESFEACAEREVLEETNLSITNIRFLTATNDVLPNGKHYVTIFVICQLSGEKINAEVMEPEKCECWEWIEWKDLKTWVQAEQTDETRDLFIPLKNVILQRPEVDLSGVA